MKCQQLGTGRTGAVCEMKSHWLRLCDGRIDLRKPAPTRLGWDAFPFIVEITDLGPCASP